MFSSGIIRTALPNMDRETRDQYVLIIQAKDMVGQMGGLSGSTSVTVTLTDVNDNPPRFSRSKGKTSFMCLPHILTSDHWGQLVIVESEYDVIFFSVKHIHVQYTVHLNQAPNAHYFLNSYNTINVTPSPKNQ